MLLNRSGHQISLNRSGDDMLLTAGHGSLHGTSLCVGIDQYMTISWKYNDMTLSWTDKGMVRFWKKSRHIMVFNKYIRQGKLLNKLKTALPGPVQDKGSSWGDKNKTCSSLVDQKMVCHSAVTRLSCILLIKCWAQLDFEFITMQHDFWVNRNRRTLNIFLMNFNKYFQRSWYIVIQHRFEYLDPDTGVHEHVWSNMGNWNGKDKNKFFSPTKSIFYME